MASANNVLKALQKGDQIRDFAHAARLFVDNNFALQPRYSCLFHVVFNLTPQAAAAFTNVDQLEINMLVKSASLPSYTFDVQTHNQYNRQVHSQHKIGYDPISIEFHDDQSDLVRSFLYTYANFYYADSKYPLGGRSYSTNDRYGGYTGEEWGYSKGNQRFFKDIRIYSMLQKRFAEYTLINPMIKSMGHDSHAYSDTNKMMTHKMQIVYETAKYATGFVNNISPRGFGDIHYDHTPSPLGVTAAGIGNSIFFRGGLVDAANSIAGDLAAGNILGGLIKGAAIFNEAKDINLKQVLTKDLERAAGTVLRGGNPLSDVVLPTILGGNGQLNTQIPGLGGVRTGDSAPVDRTYATPGINPTPIVRSNGNSIVNTQFNQPQSFISQVLNIGNTSINPRQSSSPASPNHINNIAWINPDTNNNINAKTQRRDEINNRITVLNQQLRADPSNSALTNEVNNLIRRRQLEFGY